MSTRPPKVVILDQYGRPYQREAVPRPTPTAVQPRASYDAAKTTSENRGHWRGADGLSGRAANGPEVRYVLRTRSRYECGNNGYAKGIVRGRANDTIGVCPRLQLSLPESAVDPDFQTAMPVPPDAARQVELRWGEWCDLTGFADKLRLMDKAETREGESFGVQISNPALPDSGPQIDLRVYEADQCSTPGLDGSDPNAVDGIVFDSAGNPVEYHFLDRHPGDEWAGWRLGGAGYVRIPADRVHHLFDPDRAGEARGIPALTPALPLFNQMREMTLAVLGAAKLAAMIAGVIESDLPSDGSGDPAPQIEMMDEVPFARNALLTMPAGQKAKAFDPSQPAPSYPDFKEEILTEAGRSIDAPQNVSTGSSAPYNFSSGRLDRLPYEQSIRIRRDRVRRILLDRLFRAWAAEGLLIPGYFPEGLPPLATWQVKWRWDGFASIDPVKDATGAEIRLRSGVSTLEREAAERGDDWEEVLEQQAREMKKRADLGLLPPTPPTGFPAPEPAEAPGNG